MSNGTGDQQPKIVEVEIDGKKVMVSEDGKDYLLRQADYTKKTQEVAEQRKALESEKQGFMKQVEAANNLFGFLEQDEQLREIFEAKLSDNQEKLKQLLGNKNENKDEISELRKEISEIKKMNQAIMFNNQQKDIRDNQFMEAKKIFLEKYGIDIEKHKDKIDSVPKSTNGNPFIALGNTALLEEIINTERAKAKKEGSELALDELMKKINNTPIIGSGSGETVEKKFSKTSDAVAATYKRLLAEKGR